MDYLAIRLVIAQRKSRAYITLNTNSPSDESLSMNISSDSEVESGLDIESDTTPMAGEGFSVDSHG